MIPQDKWNHPSNSPQRHRVAFKNLSANSGTFNPASVGNGHHQRRKSAEHHRQNRGTKKGKTADLIAIKPDSLETQPTYDPPSSLMYSCSQESVEHVWVAGRQLLKQRRLTTLDENELLENIAEWQRKIAAHEGHHTTDIL